MIGRLKSYLNKEWLWLKLSYTFRWAHHPTCDPYASQRFDILGISLCQGCTLITIGAILGFLTFLIFQVADLLIFGISLLVTILLVGIVDGFGGGRLLKRTTRISIGLSFGIAISQLFFYTWLIKAGIFALITSFFFGYRYFRKISPPRDLCQSCEELPLAPRCSGVIDKLEANKKYRELVLPVVDPSMIQQLEQKAALALQEAQETE